MRSWVRHGPVAPVAGPGPDTVALVDALRRLPEAQRSALVLHHMGGRSVAEIAAEGGVAVGTVKARLHRGRQALAVLLGEEPARVPEPVPTQPSTVPVPVPVPVPVQASGRRPVGVRANNTAAPDLGPGSLPRTRPESPPGAEVEPGPVGDGDEGSGATMPAGPADTLARELTELTAHA